MVVIFGCDAPMGSQEVTRVDRLDANTRQLLDDLLVSLQEKDWNSLQELHWDGGEWTADKLRETYEPMLDRIGGAKNIFDKIEYLPMTADNYLDYIDEEELPGPSELMQGRMELNIVGAEKEKFIRVWAYLAKVDGKSKIFGYIDLGLEY